MPSVMSCGLPATVRVPNPTASCDPCLVDTAPLGNAKSFATATFSVTDAVRTTVVTPLTPVAVMVTGYRPGTTFGSITNDNVSEVPVVTVFDENDAVTPAGNADMVNATSCGLPA